MWLSFMPRPQDAGALSAHLFDYVTPEDAATNPHKPADRSFGLCILDVAQLSDVTKGAVRVRYNPTNQFIGHAHVQILGCDSEDVSQQLADLAQVIWAPGARP